jgi:DNA-binding transcriptional regulator YiaG
MEDKMVDAKKCTTCGRGKFVPADIEVRRSVAGHVFVTVIRGLKCDQCDEDRVAGLDFERFDLLVARELLSAKPSADAFKFARKALGFSGKDLAELLDVAPESVSRWETGKHAIDRQGWALLRLMIADRLAGNQSTENVLRAAAAPASLPDRVDLKVA